MAEFANWIDGPEEFDRCQVGDVFLPGIITVLGLSVGIDVDIKKQRGGDGPTSEDNGIDAARFQIELHLVAADWEAWLTVLPRINPRRPGAARQPLEIRHPMPNQFGITQILITDIKPGVPSARGGMKIILECLEFFPAPKPVKKTKSKTVKHTDNSKYTGDPKELARYMNERQGFVPFPPPSDPNSIAGNLF